MKIRFEIRSQIRSGAAVPLYVRLVDGRAFHQAVRTWILVTPEFWDRKGECVRGRGTLAAKERLRVRNDVRSLRSYLQETYSQAKKDGVSGVRGWLASAVCDFRSDYASDADRVVDTGFDVLFDRFLSGRKIGEGRRRHYEVLRRMVRRYESYVRYSSKVDSFVLDIRKIDCKVLGMMHDYIANESEYVVRYPGILADNPEVRRIKPRGGNYVCGIFRGLRAFFSWACKSGLVARSPFDGFEMPSERYGSPVYLTVADVRKIYEADLSAFPHLAVQRDIFVFQCNVGCRVGDLMRLEKRDVVRGAIEYIPAKTIKKSARTVVVPLNSVACEIVHRYSGWPGSSLLPFESPEKFNDDIKRILEMAGVTYLVTELDTLTRREKKIPINKIASSHMARRIFIGNIYKTVRDPSLVSSLTGHAEGSRAFCRYRTIDIDIKKDLVKILEGKNV